MAGSSVLCNDHKLLRNGALMGHHVGHGWTWFNALEIKLIHVS